MKYICLGYIEEGKWEGFSQSEREALMDECFTYDDLRKGGHFVGGEALQSARNAVTLQWRNSKVSTIDGPYAETKEQLGGDSHSRSQGPQSRDSVDVGPSGSKGGTLRNSPGRGFVGNGDGKRATAFANLASDPQNDSRDLCLSRGIRATQKNGNDRGI